MSLLTQDSKRNVSIMPEILKCILYCIRHWRIWLGGRAQNGNILWRYFSDVIWLT